MPDETPPPAGKRFSADLRRIREEREVSIDDVHHDTRIARTLIKSFEEGRLYNHPTYNRVYLRSFVQAYAEAVDISPDAALSGLDAALDGTYENELTVQFLEAPTVDEREEESTDEPSDGPSGAPPSGGSSSMGNVSAGGAEGRGGIVGPPRAVGEERSSGDSVEELSEPSTTREKPEDTSSPEKSAEAAVDDEMDEEQDPASDGSDPGESRAGEPASESPWEDDDVDSSSQSEGAPSWMEEDAANDRDESEADSVQRDAPPAREDSAPAERIGGTGIVGEPTKLGGGGDGGEPNERPAASNAPSPPTASGPSSRSSSRSSGFFGNQNRQVYLTGIGIAVLMLVLIGLTVAYFSGENRMEGETQVPSTPPDTTVSAVQKDTTTSDTQPPEQEAPPPAGISLGETMHLTVLATANVSELRIQRDSDLRRPYWIEEGEAAVFPFRRWITVENELADIRLFLEGYPYPIRPGDAVGELEITRSTAEAFADTLQGEPTNLSVATDTLPPGIPGE